ncbi:ly6/PLAUR domain-containing protein 6-like [Ruditapes philippinarum]|uniref:ly6/PLAUR domain-containing protein 6-like n=1 Tax=Ruditapes philippinarum TaxID=129788 RepID=UPI00295B18CC|nr:ly6/PLAUR domain-containing protein 6-like [Ruditapes philippinarum]
MAYLLSFALVLLVVMTTGTFGVHIHIDYRNFEALTCYTCPMKKDNEQCNNWAPNIPCPFRHTVCKTVHRINERTGESIQVDKMCAMPEQCSNDHVGCKATGLEGEIECISCCTVSYCNVAVPYNVTTSQTMSASLIGSTASHVTKVGWLNITVTLAFLIILRIV